MTASQVDGRKARAAERREETRERLLAAALAVFAEQCFEAGTTKAITQRAGAAEGLLFHYFPTKTDLLVAVLRRDPLGPEIQRLLAEHAAEPVAEALPRMTRRWLAVLRAQRPITLGLLQQAHVDPQVQQAILEVLQGITDLLAAYFRERIATGELRPFDPDVAARILLHAVCSLIMPCSGVPAGAEEQVLDRQLDLLLHGMVGPAAHQPVRTTRD